MFVTNLIAITIWTVVVVVNPVESDECLDAHNFYRSLHDVPPLATDPELERFAQSRADEIESTDNYAHDHPRLLKANYGENLHMQWTNDSSVPPPTCALSVKKWYKEIKDYKGELTPQTGHFTAIVWKETEKVGCAKSKQSKQMSYYVVCNYSPAGNILGPGEFEKNVLPATGTGEFEETG